MDCALRTGNHMQLPNCDIHCCCYHLLKYLLLIQNIPLLFSVEICISFKSPVGTDSS